MNEFEKLLSTTEVTVQSFLENLPVAVLLKDLLGRIVFANQKYLQICHYELDQILGKTEQELPVSLCDGECSQLENNILSTGESVHLVKMIPATEEEEEPRWVEQVKSPWKDAQGNICGIQELLLDVTDQKIAEKAFTQERSLVQALLSNIPDSIYFKDLQSKFVRINKSMADKFGLDSPKEAKGLSDHDFFTADHADQARLDEQRIIETGEPIVAKVERETWPSLPDSWCSTTKMPWQDSDGEIIGTFGISRDITDIVQVEHALESERDLMQTLMDGLPDLIFFKDRQGRFMKVNLALATYFGAEHPNELIGKTDYDFTAPELAASFAEDDQAVMRSGDKLIAREEVNEDSVGNVTYFLTTKVPIRNTKGKVTGLVGIGRDITSLKKAQLDLAKARDQADAANRAKSDFLANMSHEIRTPMNAIIGMTELLEDTTLNESQKEYLRMVRDSGEVLLELINDILDFSKIESGKFTLDEFPFELHEMLGDTMKSIAVRAHRKKLELAMHIDPEVPRRVLGDPGRLRQILVNLVGNAIKFTDQGEVLVDVSAQQEGDQYQVTFRVKDTGIGIAENRLQSIFNAFEQADASTTRRYGGTGLGLAITSRLVNLMEGEIDVESQAEQGSTFLFTIPLKKTDGEEPQKLAHPEKLNQMPVLIVDDNSTNRRIMEEMLLNVGMKPKVVSSAAEAYWAIKDAHSRDLEYPLILTDVNMPDVDGFMLIERIRETQELKQPIIIVLTSGDRPSDYERCAHLNVEAHLMKPVKQSELLDAISKAFGVSSLRDRKSPEFIDASAQAMSTMNILVAEDAYANQVLARGLLEKWNHQVTIANNGQEVLDLLDQNSFDVILMDIQMPEMDGFQATRLIRKRQDAGEWTHLRTNPIPIVAMTAHAMKGDRERCLAVGMDDYVTKPIRVADLKLALSNIALSKFDINQITPEASLNMAKDFSHFSIEQALETVDGDPDLLRIIVKAFLEECPKHQQGLTQSLESGDLKTVHRLSHLIKGVAANLGASQVQEIARNMEDETNEPVPDDWITEMTRQNERLNTALQSLTEELNAYCSGQ